MKIFRFAQLGATWKERLIACLGAGIAMALTSFVCSLALGERSPLLLGPIAASAVLVFAVPASPLAQPWRVIGGNVISAFIGLATVQLIPDATLAAELALVLAMIVMSATRSFHPPGGALALTTALSDPTVEKWGVLFPLLPVGLNAAALVLVGIAFHAMFRRSYPHRPANQPVMPASYVPTLTPEDVDHAVAEMGNSFDIAREDLDRLLSHAEVHAATRIAAAAPSNRR
jgi:CBS domain-containing membrane protein